MSKKYKNVCRDFNYIEYSLILISTITQCISISVFPPLVGIASSGIGLKICVITTGLKNIKSISKKTKNKNDKIVSLAKSKLNSIEFLRF